MVDRAPEVGGVWMVLSVLLIVIVVHLLLESSGLRTCGLSAIIVGSVRCWSRNVILSERLLMVTVILHRVILA